MKKFITFMVVLLSVLSSISALSEVVVDSFYDIDTNASGQFIVLDNNKTVVAFSSINDISIAWKIAKKYQPNQITKMSKMWEGYTDGEDFYTIHLKAEFHPAYKPDLSIEEEYGWFGGGPKYFYSFRNNISAEEILAHISDDTHVIYNIGMRILTDGFRKTSYGHTPYQYEVVVGAIDDTVNDSISRYLTNYIIDSDSLQRNLDYNLKKYHTHLDNKYYEQFPKGTMAYDMDYKQWSMKEKELLDEVNKIKAEIANHNSNSTPNYPTATLIDTKYTSGEIWDKGWVSMEDTYDIGLLDFLNYAESGKYIQYVYVNNYSITVSYMVYQ